jgi:hypothetical protein
MPKIKQIAIFSEKEINDILDELETYGKVVDKFRGWGMNTIKYSNGLYVRIDTSHSAMSLRCSTNHGMNKYYSAQKVHDKKQNLDEIKQHIKSALK